MPLSPLKDLFAASVLIGCLLRGALAAAPEQDVQAPGPLAPLHGTLAGEAKSAAPVVLIVPGSGPTDRDGNGPLGLKASTYRLLAEGLAAGGVRSVRIDKRGLFGSAAAVLDANAVTIDDYAADVSSWVQALRQQLGVSCVWVLGHSEGGLVALTAAQRDPAICGLVLVATAGRPLAQVMREQLEANPANAPILADALGAIDALEAGRRVDVSAMHPALQRLYAPAVQGFLISTMARDPAPLIAAVQQPVLILQGERDLQVGVADARRLATAAPKARLVLLPAVNHVLKAVATPDLAANFATYAAADLPLAPGVVEAVRDFIRPAPR